MAVDGRRWLRHLLPLLLVRMGQRGGSLTPSPCVPADAFAYIARYDRVYLRGLAATGIQIVANQPVTPGGGDYLSDHFGLLCTATLT